MQTTSAKTQTAAPLSMNDCGCEPTTTNTARDAATHVLTARHQARRTHPAYSRLSALLGISNRGCTGGTNGNQIVVADFPDVARAQGDQSLGATRGGHEFHFDGIG